MDTLVSIRVFCTVAELKSFTAAAERLGMSPAMTSKQSSRFKGGRIAGRFHLAGRFRSDPLRNRSNGQSFICLGARTFEKEPRHELRHDAGRCACRVLV